MTPESLHPCTACGGDAEVHEYYHEGHLFVGQCCACGQRANASTNRQRAIDFWQAWNEPVMVAQEETTEPVDEPTEESTDGSV